MRRAVRGFTLLEVLLATTLLAAGLAIAFATLRAAGAGVQRGEAIAERNERIRAVSSFVRRRLAGAQGMAFNLDPTSGQALRFEGDASGMRFVADLPDYLGRGGPHLHVFDVANDGDGLALRVRFQLVMAGEVLAVPGARGAEPLADGLRTVRFAYRTLERDGQPGAWLSRWETTASLPTHVRLQVEDARGAWPDVVVALPLAGAYVGNAGVVP